LPSYAYRRQITIAAQAPIPAGYSLAIHLDHAALVAASKSLSSGADVRLFRREGVSAWTELDRVVDPASAWDTDYTTIWFRTQSIVGAGTDSSCYLYYGDPAATAAPKDPQQVYAFWDDFDQAGLAGWTFSIIGAATGTAEVTGGHLHIQAHTGDIWNETDDFVFLHRPVQGDFVADVLVSDYGGNLDGWAKVGGVMIRQSTANGSRNRIMAPANGSAARTNSFRLADNQSTAEYCDGAANPIPEHERVVRRGSFSTAWYSADGLTWPEWGTEIEFTEQLSDPVLVGIPFATNGGGEGWVDIDWFRLRTFVSPEPAVELGSEETAPF